jgi:short-subunit dehydrogenase
MGKTILITGAGTGIGRDSAIELSKRGHRVIATTHTQTQADDLQAQCQQNGWAMDTFKLDITLPSDREKILPLELDVLVNNGAIGDSGSLAEVSIDRVRQTFEVNVFATLELTQLALKGMIARQRGTVVFVSSIVGRIPMPFLMPYSMTKFALSAAGAALRAEMDTLGKNVNVCIVEPGAYHTGFNQSMAEKKYEWMSQESYFQDRIPAMKAREGKEFRMMEAKSTASIVAKIVKASEAKRPSLRYVAPWIQGAFVRLARILGI